MQNCIIWIINQVKIKINCSIFLLTNNEILNKKNYVVFFQSNTIIDSNILVFISMEMEVWGVK